MTYARVVIVLHLYLLEQCLNPVLWTSIIARNFVTFYKFLIHLGMHHTSCTFVSQWSLSHYPFLQDKWAVPYFLLSLTGIPYLTLHNAISLVSFQGFFLFFNLNLLIASSSSASAMESSGFYSSHISFHSFHSVPLGNCLSALLHRFTLFHRLIAKNAWMNSPITFFFMSTVSLNFFSLSVVKSNGPLSFTGSLFFEIGIKTFVKSLIHEVSCHLHFPYHPIITMFIT